MTEEQRAEMGASQIAASDAYFQARPHLDIAHSRVVFEAAFERGYQAAVLSEEEYFANGPKDPSKNARSTQ